jgi:hypothetical protein
MSRILLYLVLVTCVSSCDTERHTPDRLTQEERDKFPRDYFHQNILHAVYADSLSRDTFLLAGGDVKTYTVTEDHSIGIEDRGNFVDFEVIEKDFKSSTSDVSLVVSAPLHPSMMGTSSGHYLAIIFSGYQYWMSFNRIENNDNDQQIPYPRDYLKNGSLVYVTDSIRYSRIKGVEKIIHPRTPDRPAFTVEFF